MDIHIEKEVAQKCPDIVLGCISCTVETIEFHQELWDIITSKTNELASQLNNEKIRKMSTIHSSKQAYKKLGKDPNRYRPSAESLLRRVANGKGLYQINNVVDLLNLVSISSGFSIGGYNQDQIHWPVEFGKGRPNEDYEGIGRGKLNIENLPILRDALGAFGSPTSDSIRTQVNNECKKFLMIIISFQGEAELVPNMEAAKDLLAKYANGKDITTQIVRA